jgi:hypothetical protein
MKNILNKIKNILTYIKNALHGYLAVCILFSILITFVVFLIPILFMINVYMFGLIYFILIGVPTVLSYAWFFLMIFQGIAKAYKEDYILKYKNTLFISFGSLLSLISLIIFLLVSLL